MARKSDIRLRRSNVANAVPGGADLNEGELAINTADGALYFKKSDGTIITGHDNTIMHIDSTNSRVGIGTTSPSYSLDVHSGTSDWPIRGISSDAKAGIVLADNNTANYIMSQSYTLSLGNQPSLHAANLNIKSTGLIGVGIINPALQSGGHGLHIHDDANSEIKFTNDTTGTSASDGTALVTSGSSFSINNREAGLLHFGTSNTTQMSITSSGNVGIGTQSPNRKLHLSGAGATVAVKVEATDGVQSSLDLKNSEGEFRLINDGGSLSIYDQADSAERLRINTNGDISFNEDTGTTAKLFWDASTERLGLGATSLTHTLHVTGSHNEMALFKRSVSGNSEVKIDTTTAGDAKLTFANNGTSEYTMGRDNSDGAFKIADGGTIGSNDRLTINVDGHVGIGTSSPSVHSGTGLVVHATTGGSGNTGSPRIRLTNTTTGQSATDGAELSLDGNTKDFYIENREGQDIIFYSGSERLRIDSSGNLLVGTTNAANASAGFRAYAGGNGAFTRASTVLDLNRLSTDGVIIQFQKDTVNVGSIGTVSNGKLMMGVGGSSGTNLIFADQFDEIYPSQNGVTTLGDPGSKFKDLYLSGVANAAGFQSNQPTNGFGYVNFGDTDDANIGQIGYDHTNNYMRFQVNNTEKMRIDSSGNLLVGTTSTVVGSATSGKGFRVDGANGIVQAAASGVVSAIFNRTSSDGDIVSLRKNGTQVGSIGSNSDALYIGSTYGTDSAIRFASSIIAPSTTTGVNRDAAIDLGYSSSRFKDIHLSGNAYIGSSAYAQYFGNSSDTNTLIQFAGSDDIRFRAGGTENMRITGTRVGIGVTAPDAMLHIEDSSSSAYGGLRVVGAGTGSGSTNVRQIADFGRTNSGSVSGVWLGGRTDETTAVIGAKTASGNIAFEVYNSGWQERMRITNTGAVGIGTNSPSSKLDVQQTTAGNIISAEFDNTDYTANNRNAIKIRQAVSSSGSYSAYLGSDKNTGNVFLSNDSITANHLVINTSGKVGIGTSSPANLLSVESTGQFAGINIKSASSNGISYLDFGDADDNNIGGINYDNSTDTLQLRNGNAHHVFLKSDGKVGIGVGSPNSLLHVSHATAPTFRLSRTGTGQVWVQSIDSSGRFQLAEAASEGGTQNTRLQVDDTGEITFNAAYTFPTSDGSANQVLKTNGSGVLTWQNDAGGGSAGTSIEDADGDTKIQVEESADEDKIRFDIAGTQKMFLDSGELNLDGNLAVSGNLNIVGDINSTSVTNLDVTDKTITMANNSGSSINADGAGIIIEGPSSNASLLWNHGNQQLRFNKEVFSPAGFVIGTTATNVGKMYNASGVMALEAYSGRSISFGNATNGEHVRIDANGNVGIGTTSPDGNLEVVASSVIDSTSDTVNNVLIGLQSANRPTIVLDTADTTYTNRTWNITNVGAVGSLVIGRHGLDVLNLKNDGKVGIGTSSPSAKTHIQYTTQATANKTYGLIVNGNDTGTNGESASILLGGLNTTARGASISAEIQSSSNDHDLIFATSAASATPSEAMRIDSSGNLLVGTTTSQPGTKLQVAGVFDVWSSTNTLLRSRHDGTRGIIETFTGGAYANTAINPSGGNVGIGTTSPSANLEITQSGNNVGLLVAGGGYNYTAKFESVDAEANIIIEDSNSTNDGNMIGVATNDMYFITDTAERMRIDSSGNVGIATTAPVYPLDVRNPSDSNQVFRVYFPDAATTQIGTSRMASGATQGLFVEGQTGVRFGVSGAEYGRFHSNGNFGIGTTSPTHKLHTVTSNTGVYIQREISSNAANLSEFNSNRSLIIKNRTGGSFLMFGGNGSRTDIQATDGAGTPTAKNIALNPFGGNVGIGTTSPSSLLTVHNSSTAGNTQLHVHNNKTGDAAVLRLEGGRTSANDAAQVLLANGGYIGSAIKMHSSGSQEGDMRFYVSGASSGDSLSEAMRIGTNGAVSIGTTTAAGAGGLLVDNDIKGNSRIGVGSGGNLSDAAIYKISDTNTGIYWPAADTLGFTTAGAERIRIDSTGNVGIGTTAPGYKLDIGGTTGNTANTLRLHQTNGGTALRIGAGGGSSDVVLWRIDGDSSGSPANHAGATNLGAYGYSLKYFGTGSGQENRLKLLADDGGSSAQKVVYNVGQNGYINFEQRVGIGTNSPDYKLEVVGNTMIGDASAVTSPGFSARQNIVSSFQHGTNGIGRGGSLYLLNTNTNRESGFLTFGAYYNNTNNLYYQTGGIGGGKETAAGSGWGGYLSFWTTSDGTAGAASGQFEHMRITADGKVGIGTTAPSKKLHVEDSSAYQLQVDGGNNFWNVGAGWSGYYDGSFLIANNTGDKLVIDSNGKVGIGTNSPAQPLHVEFSGDAGARIESTNNHASLYIDAHTAYGSYLRFSQAGSNKYWINVDTNGKMLFRPSATGTEANLITFDSTGQVGIGKTTVKAKLQVEELGIDTTITTTSATALVTLASLNITHFRSARFTIQITNTTDSTYHSTEILAIHDGTTANITEFGEVHTGSSVEATFDADVSSGNFRLLATPASTNNMVFKVVSYAITV